MSIHKCNDLLQHLRRAAFRQDSAELTDGRLLAAFVERRDEAALVHRHAAMVWGVCGRLLHPQEAEDAFQATFLVLVRKAAAIVPRERVGNWLYGVAHRTALQAQRNAARRHEREKRVADMPEPTVAVNHPWPVLRLLLDEELSRLPEKYRSAIVLCDLEGRTRRDAARQLGVPEGSVAGWLARGRAMLAQRLTRRGITLSGGSLAAVLVEQAASAGAPPSVVSAAIAAAAALAAGPPAMTGAVSTNVAALVEGVLKSMLWNKLKITATFLLALAVASVSAGGLLLPAPVAQEAQVPAPKEKGSDKLSEERTKQPGAPPKKDITPPADPPRKPSAAMVEAARQFQAIEEEWDRARQKYETALRGAKTKVARDAVAARDRPDPEPYARRFLRLYREFPDTWGGAAALYWIACNAQDAEAAGQALATLKGGPIAHGDLDLVWGLFFLRSDPSAAPARELAPLVYARAVHEPRHPKAPDLLIWVCRAAAGDRSDAGSKLYREAGDRLVAESPDGMYAWRFAELLRDSGDPAWAERHLRTMLAKGKDPANRVAASFALATLLQNKDEATQQEAERHYRLVVEEAARAADRWNQAALKLPESIHLFPDGDHWVRLAKAQLAEIKARGLGRPAPDLVGEDLDGKPMRLSDYRGKVVLLSFWATWCPPCMALVPHERELVKRMDGNRFAVVGVNGDKELTAAQKAAADKGITWRSFRNRAGSGPAISEAWAIAGWPTLYLIDHEGVIRRRWVGAPANEVLSREVERLVGAAGHDR